MKRIISSTKVLKPVAIACIPAIDIELQTRFDKNLDMIFKVLIQSDNNMQKAAGLLLSEHQIEILPEVLKKYVEDKIESNQFLLQKLNILKKEYHFLSGKFCGKDTQEFRRLVLASDFVEYYELMILKIEKRMLEVEDASIILGKTDHVAYSRYLQLIKSYRDKVVELTLLADLKKMQEDLIMKVSQIVMEVFLSYIPVDKKFDAVSIYKERLQLLDDTMQIVSK